MYYWRTYLYPMGVRDASSSMVILSKATLVVIITYVRIFDG